ncbi:MAG: hypothetical protein WCV84_05445 [Patescibacteria group bacterium]
MSALREKSATRFFVLGIFCLASFLFLVNVRPVVAADCFVEAETSIDQAYVDNNSCTSLNIGGDGFTVHWGGVVDISGDALVYVTGTNIVWDQPLELGATDDFTLESGASITHAAGSSTGIQLTADAVTITGTIDVDGKGCQGDTGDSGYGPDPDTGICAISTGGFGFGLWGGGAYGGFGGKGSGNTEQWGTYGSSTAPTYLGSSGAAWSSSDAVAGSGGGRVQIFAAGTITIDGVITADGTNGTPGGGSNGAGGGSGGSVYVKASTLAGSGSVSANAGAGAMYYGGGGGGGRVAILYDTLSGFTRGNATAIKGAPGVEGYGMAGGNGTTWILDRQNDDGSGDLYITSGVEIYDGIDLVRSTITLGDGAMVTCTSTNSTVFEVGSFSGVTFDCRSPIPDFTIQSASALSITNSALLFSGGHSSVTVSSTGALTFDSTTTSFSAAGLTTFHGSSMDFIASFISYGTTTRMTWDAPGTSISATSTRVVGPASGQTLAGNGILTIPGAPVLTLAEYSAFYCSVTSTLSSLSIDATSRIDASGKGCPGYLGSDAGYGPDAVTRVCTVSQTGYGVGLWGGGGYGGAGGRGSPGWGSTASATYGKRVSPSHIGSSGASWSSAPNDMPGAGGGLVSLSVAGAATILGPILADGVLAESPSGNGAGGGSGGTIYLSVDTLNGSSGSLSSKGGGAAYAYGGGGGGGRIAVHYSTLNDFPLTDTTYVTTSGGSNNGTSGDSGSDGTVWYTGVNVPPDAPTGLGPSGIVDGSTTSTNQPQFEFTLADENVADEVAYRIQIDDGADFIAPEVDYVSVTSSQGVRYFRVGQAEGSGLYIIGSASQTLANTTYYWRVLTTDASNESSVYTTANGGSPAFTVLAAAVAISISTDGTIAFGNIALGATTSTLPTAKNDPQTITVDAGPAALQVRSSTFTTVGLNTWTFGEAAGNDTVKFEYSTDTLVWTTFSLADTLYSIDANVAQSDTRTTYYQITVPTATGSYDDYATTITVVATAP